jgi:hypothetical protein
MFVPFGMAFGGDGRSGDRCDAPGPESRGATEGHVLRGSVSSLIWIKEPVVI